MTKAINPMLEKVARALCGHFGPHDFDALPVDKPAMKLRQRAGEQVFDTQEDMLDAARAAVQALMEPDEAMLDAGLREAPIIYSQADDVARAFTASFRAMLQTILEDGQ